MTIYPYVSEYHSLLSSKFGGLPDTTVMLGEGNLMAYATPKTCKLSAFHFEQLPIMPSGKITHLFAALRIIRAPEVPDAFANVFVEIYVARAGRKNEMLIPIPNTKSPLFPNLGNVNVADRLLGEWQHLNIPVEQGDRLILVFSIEGGSNSFANSIIGSLSGQIGVSVK